MDRHQEHPLLTRLHALHRARFETAASSLPVFCLIALYLRTACVTYPSFDGAMNLNVARSIAEGHGYAFRYDSLFPFPAQTDGPFVLPAALVFRLFGIGLLTSQSIGLLYFAAFGLLVVAVLRRLGASPWLASAGACACMLTPGMGDYGLNGFGEIPMLDWLLAGMLAAGRGRFGCAGVLFSLAVLTKIVALLGALPAILVCAAMAPGIAAPRHRRLLAAGFVAPLLAWEAFRLISLGSAAAWYSWWALQLDQVGRQSGGSDAARALAAAPQGLLLHLRLLSTQLGVPTIPLAAWLAGPWLLGLQRLARPRPDRPPPLLFLPLLLCPMLYAAWWLLLTPPNMAWLRRILPGLLLQTCLIAALVAQGPRLARMRVVLVLLALPGELMLLRTGAAISPRPVIASERRDVDRVVAMLRALPADAVVFGVGWWQAPLFALLSDRTIMNLDRWTPDRINALHHAYFVVDPAAAALAGTRVLQVFKVATLQPLLREPDAALYRIMQVDPDRGLESAAPLTPGFDGLAVAQTAGWYLPDGGWAWVSPESTIRLGRTDQTRLLIDAAFWDELFAHGPRHLHVQAAGCLDQLVTIPSSGARRIVLPLACPGQAAVSPMTIVLSFDGVMPIPPQLDADTRNLAFEIHGLMLER